MQFCSLGLSGQEVMCKSVPDIVVCLSVCLSFCLSACLVWPSVNCTVTQYTHTHRSASQRLLLWRPNGELWWANHGIDAPEGHRASMSTPPTFFQHAQ